MIAHSDEAESGRGDAGQVAGRWTDLGSAAGTWTVELSRIQVAQPDDLDYGDGEPS